MNFVQMRAFHAVAQYGTMAAAAKVLGVSKPAVAMQIKALEEIVGSRLFHRKGHSLEISETGQLLLEPVRTMSRILGEIESIVSQKAENREGMLRIGACAPFVLLPIIAAFNSQYNGIRFQAEFNNSESLADKIRDNELDVAIATLYQANPDFHCIRLLTQHVRAIVPVTHPWGKKSHINIKELQGVPCVMRESGSMTRQILEDKLDELGIKLDVRFEFGSREAVKEAVASGLGTGFVLDREIGRDYGVVGVPIAGADLSAGEYLFCLKDLAGLRTIQLFLEVTAKVYPETKT